MKTSNKLLIAFALLMFIIPLTIMAVSISNNYKDVNLVKEQEKADLHFKNATDGFVSRAIAKSFNSVNIKDGKDMSWSIRVIKDEVSGVKIAEEFKDLIATQVDENGVLQISINKGVETFGYYRSIYIYTPAMAELTVNKSSSLELNLEADSLKLNLKNISAVNLGERLKLASLSVSAENVGEITLSGQAAAVINMNLKSSGFKSEYKSYNLLNVNASDNSSLNIFGSDQNEKNYEIKNLVINTSGKVNVKLEEIGIDKVSGSLSDSTIINVPVGYLKKMIK